jgi:uncharacterized membrane protein
VFYLFPLINTGVYAMLLALPWLSPRKFKIDDFRPVYDYIAFLMVVLFAALQGIILYGQSQGELPGRLFLGVFFAFFGLLGNVLGKVRKNFYVGIRTPWTLASETVWEKTHRLGAWLFVATGVGGFVAVMLGAPFWWCFPAILVAAFVPVIYSLIIYKQLERAGKLDVPTDGAGTTTV